MEEKDINTEETVCDAPEQVNQECAQKDKDKEKGKKSKAKTALLEKENEELKEKLAQSEDKYLRLAAEYENFRKRSKSEREGIYSDAAADALRELLPIFDNLARATEYTNPEKVAEGLELILKSLPDVFSKMKVTVFGKAGEQFDPNLHNAVMHIEDSEYGENEIVDVFQQGYMLGDKIVRYAMVRVAN